MNMDVFKSSCWQTMTIMKLHNITNNSNTDTIVIIFLIADLISLFLSNRNDSLFTSLSE